MFAKFESATGGEIVVNVNEVVAAERWEDKETADGQTNLALTNGLNVVVREPLGQVVFQLTQAAKGADTGALVYTARMAGECGGFKGMYATLPGPDAAGSGPLQGGIVRGDNLGAYTPSIQ